MAERAQAREGLSLDEKVHMVSQQIKSQTNTRWTLANIDVGKDARDAIKENQEIQQIKEKKDEVKYDDFSVNQHLRQIMRERKKNEKTQK